MEEVRILRHETHGFVQRLEREVAHVVTVDEHLAGKLGGLGAGLKIPGLG